MESAYVAFDTFSDRISMLPLTQKELCRFYGFFFGCSPYQLLIREVIGAFDGYSVGLYFVSSFHGLVIFK